MLKQSLLQGLWIKSAAGNDLAPTSQNSGLGTNDHLLGNGALGPWVHVTLLLGGVTDIR